MKTVYICAPLKGDIRGNIEKARIYTRYALKCGVAPVTSHFFALCIDDDIPEERKLGMDAGLTLMNMCDELWVFGKELTAGMQREFEYAKHRLRIPIRHLDTSEIIDFMRNEEGGNAYGN